ncbi:MAG: hypothetical protein Q8L88_09475 [Bacteroidota bacterium]|nr:hypothetical protein [Bacteroidota bacterium]
MRKNILLLTLVITIGINNTFAQEINDRVFYFGPSIGTKIPSGNLKAFGGSVGGEFMFSDIFGFIAEYSSTHYYGTDQWNLLKDADVTYSGPGLLICYHLYSSDKNFEVFAALGSSYTTAKGTLGTTFSFFGNLSNKARFIPSSKLGLRWWVNDKWAVRGGFASIGPISIGFDYCP